MKHLKNIIFSSHIIKNLSIIEENEAQIINDVQNAFNHALKLFSFDKSFFNIIIEKSDDISIPYSIVFVTKSNTQDEQIKLGVLLQYIRLYLESIGLGSHIITKKQLKISGWFPLVKLAFGEKGEIIKHSHYKKGGEITNYPMQNDSDIARILEAAAFAPSILNFQAWSYQFSKINNDTSTYEFTVDDASNLLTKATVKYRLMEIGITLCNFIISSYDIFELDITYSNIKGIPPVSISVKPYKNNF